MTTSEAGLRIIRTFEGCRLQAYRCPAGVWTIGYGHTQGVSQGDVISKADAEHLLRTDLEPVEAEIHALRLNLRQNQFDALASFIFNIGTAAFRNKSSVRRYIIEGRTDEEIAEKFLLWNKANGVALQGLTNRRKMEADLFKKP